MKYVILVFVMGLVRTTIVLDELIVTKIRQDFGGNLSKGINSLLKEHLFVEKRQSSAFGLLKGRVSFKDWEQSHKELRQEDEKYD